MPGGKSGIAPKPIVRAVIEKPSGNPGMSPGLRVALLK
jgi:hypothetical protein